MLSSSVEAFAPPRLSAPSSNLRRSTTPLAATVERTDAPPTTSVFLTPESAKACIDLAGSPVFAYSLERLQDAANKCLAFPNAYGLTVRYAMKACPNATILKYFHSRGIHIDASSGYEVKRAMAAGIPAENISLSSQELPDNFEELIKLGVKINAWYVFPSVPSAPPTPFVLCVSTDARR
jgi:diaminopimelate decarboxylase